MRLAHFSSTTKKIIHIKPIKRPNFRWTRTQLCATNRYVNADRQLFWLIGAHLDADQSKRYERAGNGPRCLDEIQGRVRQKSRFIAHQAASSCPRDRRECHKLRELSWVVRYNRYWHYCICNVFGTKAQKPHCVCVWLLELFSRRKYPIDFCEVFTKLFFMRIMCYFFK